MSHTINEGKKESVSTCNIRNRKQLLLKLTWTQAGIALWHASSNQSALNYVIFNLISAPCVHPPPPFPSSGTCRTQQPLHNTTKTISLCGSRLEYPLLLFPEHRIIIRGFMLGACVKLIAHTSDRARGITNRKWISPCARVIVGKCALQSTNYSHPSSCVIFRINKQSRWMRTHRSV